MNHVRLTDLDELALTIRDAKSKAYITEAVDAYRGGAYRSAIVATWIAVTFDIISKIRELALQGDALANSLIVELDNAISAHNLKKLQTLEDDLLRRAKVDFEFLSGQEYSDLLRLKEDRNLCAHPAFVAEESLFGPEPERVRMHIVHAVRHLLQHQPVQGKSALGRLVADIKSATFPTEADTVSVYLNARYLNRAKKVLVQNLIVVLLKALLRGDDPDLPATLSSQILLTLQAVARKDPTTYEARVSEKLPALVETLEDSLLPNVFPLIGSDARCWIWIGEPSRLRLRATVSLAFAQPDSRNLILGAMGVDELMHDIIGAFNSLPLESQIGVIAAAPRPEFAEKAIRIYSSATSYRSAERLGATIIVPMAQCFSANDVKAILDAAKANSQIWNASRTPLVLEQLFDGTMRFLTESKNAWRELVEFLAPNYSFESIKGLTWTSTNWKGLVKRMEEAGIPVSPIPATSP